MLLSSLPTKISKCVQMRNDLPVTGLVLVRGNCERLSLAKDKICWAVVPSTGQLAVLNVARSKLLLHKNSDLNLLPVIQLGHS